MTFDPLDSRPISWQIREHLFRHRIQLDAAVEQQVIAIGSALNTNADTVSDSELRRLIRVLRGLGDLELIHVGADTGPRPALPGFWSKTDDWSDCDRRPR